MPTAVALCQKRGSDRLSRKVSGIGNKTFDILRALAPLMKPNLSHKVTKIGSAGRYSISSFLMRYRSARKLMPRSFAAAVLL